LPANRTRSPNALPPIACGDEVLGRAVIVASGVEYRRLGVASLERWTGAGLFYGVAGAEAHTW